MKYLFKITFVFLLFTSIVKSQNQPFQGENGKWGVKNAEGKVILQPVYDQFLKQTNSLWFAQLGEEYCALEKATGQEKFRIYMHPETGMQVMDGETNAPYNNLWIVYKKVSGKTNYGIVNYQNPDKMVEVYPIELHYVPSYHNGLARITYVWNNGGVVANKTGYINPDGKWIIPQEYQSIQNFKEGLVMVMKNGKYGFVDTKNQAVVPLIYEQALIFSDGLAAVKLNGKWGYVDKSGNLVIDMVYDEAYDFIDGKADVEMGGKDFCINKRGERISSCF